MQAENTFSKYYELDNWNTPASTSSTKKHSIVGAELHRYTHEEALEFAASTSQSKKVTDKSHRRLQEKKDYEVRTFESESGNRAYYRVVSKKRDSYVMEACHVNVHGHHRGDLRFIEVNNRTVVKGSERYSVMGKLYLGDIVAVTELGMLREPVTNDVLQTTVHQECGWLASKITVLPRSVLEGLTLSVLNPKDNTAVVKDHGELMTLQEELKLECGQLFQGDAFIPERIVEFFCQDYNPERKDQLIAHTSKIHQEPNPLGTIFEVRESPELKEIFEIGVDAFKKTSVHNTPASEIVETCVLMGYCAANALAFGRLDTRSFPIQNAERRGRLLHFFIDNPTEQPTENKWSVGNRISIHGAAGGAHATIETVLIVMDGLKISARLSKQAPNHLKFTGGLFLVSQLEPINDDPILKNGFFKRLPEGSHGRRILEALYGGSKLPKYPVAGKSFRYFSEKPVELNKFQSEYVEMLQDRKNHPIVVASSPFGCGKSMTIVTAAVELSKIVQPSQKQLLITQSNFASVNLVEIARRVAEGPNSEEFRFVRFITSNNSKAVAEDCLTSYDLPVLMERVFMEWAKGKHQVDGKYHHILLSFLLTKQLIHPENLAGQALGAFEHLKKKQKNWRPQGGIGSHLLEKPFVMLYRPNVIMVTADSLRQLLQSKLLEKEDVTTIQIDEASQLPEYSFVSLLTRFPHANFGLIGDIQQLPPYCELGLEGKLKDYGIGNTMERAVIGGLFPQAMLREVYRCHPKTTDLLSDLFYGGKLISGITEGHRKKFMEGRPDFWKNSNFPVMLINNQGRTQKIGTSCGNSDEKEIVKRLLGTLTTNYKGYKLQESEIGVISFYKGQTSVLIDALRGSGVKCGTVDAFQGTEKEVIILCCTNEQISEFMQLGNRLNVAMSRAKQVTIIVGNVDGLRKAKYWETIVERAEKHGCVMEADALLKVYMAPRTKPSSSRAPTTARPGPAQTSNTNSYDDFPNLSSQKSAMKVAVSVSDGSANQSSLAPTARAEPPKSYDSNDFPCLSSQMSTMKVSNNEPRTTENYKNRNDRRQNDRRQNGRNHNDRHPDDRNRNDCNQNDRHQNDRERNSSQQNSSQQCSSQSHPKENRNRGHQKQNWNQGSQKENWKQRNEKGNHHGNQRQDNGYRGSNHNSNGNNGSRQNYQSQPAPSQDSGQSSSHNNGYRNNHQQNYDDNYTHHNGGCSNQRNGGNHRHQNGNNGSYSNQQAGQYSQNSENHQQGSSSHPAPSRNSEESSSYSRDYSSHNQQNGGSYRQKNGGCSDQENGGNYSQQNGYNGSYNNQQAGQHSQNYENQLQGNSSQNYYKNGSDRHGNQSQPVRSNHNSNGNGSYNRKNNQYQPARSQNSWEFSSSNSGNRDNNQQNRGNYRQQNDGYNGQKTRQYNQSSRENGGSYGQQNGSYSNQRSSQYSQNFGNNGQGSSNQNQSNNQDDQPQQSRARYDSAPKTNEPIRRSRSPYCTCGEVICEC